MKSWRGIATAAALLVTVVTPAAALAFDPVLEVKNFAKINERFEHVTATPEFQARLQQANVKNNAETAFIQATDTERKFTNICGTRTNECAGDVRFYDWRRGGAAMRKPFLFTARNGATLSGNMWATKRGLAEAPCRGDHDWIGAGARDALLGPGGDPGEARLCGDDVRRPGPEPLGRTR